MPGPSTHPRRRQRTRHGHSSREDTPEVDDPAGSAGQVGQGGTQPPATASELVQQAADATTELKALLKNQTPWSKDAFNVRQRARNAYLCILFQHPLHPQAQSIELLWISTTYTLISAYRDAVARIEATLPAPGSGARANKEALSHLRTTLSRFRQALVKEAAFYHSLITRIVTFHRLQDRTAAYLAEVNIPVGREDAEDDPSLAPHLSKEELDKKIDIVYKGLVCLGDLERYKEQYSDKARKERDGAPAKNNGRDPAERFNKAIMYYEVARALQPDNGTAFNQLAVIDGYLGDNFHCTYHYFRALEVRLPFPSGEANLERVLKKVFDKWRSQRHAEKEKEKENGGEQQSPAAAAGAAPDSKESQAQDDTDAFKRDLLIVVSILFIRAGTSHFNALCSQVSVSFARLLRERKLLSETIVKTTAMAIGSHWQARLGANKTSSAGAERLHVVENLSLILLMSIFTSLVVVAAEQAEEALSQINADDSAVVEEDEEIPLAQRITAVLRRLLPSLRIMSRWLKSHIEYVGRLAPASPEVARSVSSFWASYKRLMFALAQVFPLAQLPELDQPLEEDRDMRGFSPLRGHRASANFDETQPPTNGEVHPNEEQLMRLADLLVDVKLLMQTDVGMRALSSAMDAQISNAAETQSQAETEDDPVNLAMRASLGGDGISVAASAENDDEVILWGNSTSTPVLPQVTSTTTAQNLLQSLTLAPSPGPAGGDRRPPLLFGGMDGGQTIWTMSREESQKGMQRARQRDSGQWDRSSSAGHWEGSGALGGSRQGSRQPSGQWESAPSSARPSGQWERPGWEGRPSAQWEASRASQQWDARSGQWDRASGQWDRPSGQWESVSRQASGQGVSRQASGQWDANSRQPSGQWEGRPSGQWDSASRQPSGQWDRPSGQWDSAPSSTRPSGQWDRWPERGVPSPHTGPPPGFGSQSLAQPPSQYGYRPGSGQGFGHSPFGPAHGGGQAHGAGQAHSGQTHGSQLGAQAHGQSFNNSGNGTASAQYPTSQYSGPNQTFGAGSGASGNAPRAPPGLAPPGPPGQSWSPSPQPQAAVIWGPPSLGQRDSWSQQGQGQQRSASGGAVGSGGQWYGQS